MTTNYRKKREEFKNASITEKRECLISTLEKIKEGQPNLEWIYTDIQSGAISNENAYIEIYNILISATYTSDQETIDIGVQKLTDASEKLKQIHFREQEERNAENTILNNFNF